MLIKTFLAFSCLVKAQRDKNDDPDSRISEITKNRVTKNEESKIEVDPMTEPNFYIDQLKALKEQESRRIRSDPSTVPVVFANDESEAQSCSYVKQADGSIIISTMHQYQSNQNCHQYWQCEDPAHNMYFKWNRVAIERNCDSDWTRFAWGNGDNKQDLVCSWIRDDQRIYQDTGTNKIVWDFQSDDNINRWGVEAQILCRDPKDANECVDGTHRCHDSAECIPHVSESGIGCK